jgi:hypothetical protein
LLAYVIGPFVHLTVGTFSNTITVIVFDFLELPLREHGNQPKTDSNSSKPHAAQPPMQLLLLLSAGRIIDNPNASIYLYLG